MPRKNLIFTVTTDLNHDQRMIRICNSLQEAGYEVSLLGRKKKNSRPTTKKTFHQQRLSCFFEKGSLFYLEMNIRLFFSLMASKTDGICAIDYDTLPAGFLAARLKGVPFVFDAHEYFSEVPEVVDRKTIKRFWEGIARLFIPRTQHCYTVGPALAKIFTERYKRPFQVIRNITSLEKPLLIKPKKEATFTLLYQGAMNQGRGLEILVASMVFLGDHIQLRLAGDGDIMEQLKEIVEKNELSNKVTFLGNLLPSALHKETKKADIGLNLLENKGLSYYYSLANKFFDYMHAGIPSINMDFPEYRSILEEHPVGIMIEEKDLVPEEIAKAIHSLTQNLAKYETLRENCILASQEMNWQKEGKKLVAFYEKILPLT